MKNRVRLARALLLVVAAQMAVPAGADPYAGEAHAQRIDTVGTSYRELGPVAEQFCVLSRVSVVDTDTASERAQCRIKHGHTSWFLEAYLGASSDADVYCSAICYFY